MNNYNNNLSVFLSLVLRHKPEEAGITIDEYGYADVYKLIEGIKYTGRDIDVKTLNEIVKSDSKNRYSYNSDNSKIRANQGHSIPVDIELNTITPPPVLYHGSSLKYLDSILLNGIISKERNHVHLSEKIEEALEVAERRKNPFILKVKSIDMYKNGYSFMKSKNNVWLTNYVPVKYIEVLPNKTKFQQ